MIPKKIHYCWFGGNPLPETAIKCIESWKKFCPDYEIIEWNESSFDLNCCAYVQEAYEAKKWAFVSDYARYDILYKNGGLYFDTDVELIQNIDDLVEKGPFMGMEKCEEFSVAPGLGIAATPGEELYKEILDFYNCHHFLNDDGSINQTTICKYTTDILLRHGLMQKDEAQCVDGIYIYPSEYFCPINYTTGELHVTEHTRSIHHYASTWRTAEQVKHHKFKQRMTVKYGKTIAHVLERGYSFPYRVEMKIKEKGIAGTLVWKLKDVMRKHGTAKQEV